MEIKFAFLQRFLALFATVCLFVSEIPFAFANDIDIRAYVSPNVTPQEPVIKRDTTGIKFNEEKNVTEFTAPHIPAIRTSNDGRIGVYMKADIDGKGVKERKFVLLRPEAVSIPFDLWDNGVQDGFLSRVVKEPFPDINDGHHVTLCDGSSNLSSNAKGDKRNPQQCDNDSDHDCYDLNLVTAMNRSENGVKGVKLFSLPIRVKVSSPKTAQAEIVSVEVTGDKRESILFPTVESALEPMFTADGRLAVFRIFDGEDTPLFDWVGGKEPDRIDMVYTSAPKGAAVCDVRQFGRPFPISHAPYDDQVNDRYGFAKKSFRDPEGNIIGDGEPLGGTYPWIDRSGSNIFFTAIRSKLYYPIKGQGVHARYDMQCLEGEECKKGKMMCGEEKFQTQGLVAMGAWTNGKMVLLDGAFSNTDYGIGVSRDRHVKLKLYSDVAGNDVWEQVGSGRDNRNGQFPSDGAANTTFIDSLEHLFNANPNFKPATPRDVVWRMSTGRGTADVAFDDFLNRHAVVVANMNASLTHGVKTEVLNHCKKDAQPEERGFMRHNDGFVINEVAKSIKIEKPRIQNAATSLLIEGVPAYGQVHGNIRIEPIAKGGVVGKGLWLNGESGVSFDLPQLDDSVFVSMFVDSRKASGMGQLLRFPDGSTLDYSFSRMRYTTSSGAKRWIWFREQSQMNEWQHIALEFTRNENKNQLRVRVYINGFISDHFLLNTENPFKQSFDNTYKITLGVDRDDSNASGLMGWVDEFKVFAYAPDMESVCNHAHGTLIGVDDLPQSNNWKKVAEKHGQGLHNHVSDAIIKGGRILYTHSQYACMHNYKDIKGLAYEKDELKKDAPELFEAGKYTFVREAFIFPEGPLLANRPRPDSTINTFCLECHISSDDQLTEEKYLKEWASSVSKIASYTTEGDSFIDTLGKTALIKDDTWLTQNDRRRQPMQPPQFVSGNVGQSLDNCDEESKADAVQSDGILMDVCFLDSADSPPHGGSVPTVTPTPRVTPTVTPTPKVTPTPTVTPTPSVTPTPTATATPTVEPIPNVGTVKPESGLSYRIIHVNTGRPMHIDGWERDSHGLLMKLKNSGVQCQGKECDFTVRTTNNGMQRIDSYTSDNCEDSNARRAIGMVFYNSNKARESVYLRRSARKDSNCVECDFDIQYVSGSMNKNKFRISTSDGYSLRPKVVDNKGFISTRLSLVKTESCENGNCDFLFVPLNKPSNVDVEEHY